MNGDLIRKSDVVNKLIRLENEYQFHKANWDAQTLYRKLIEVELEIGKTPAVDAEPVVHAHWVSADDVGDCCYRCSRCGRVIDRYYEDDDGRCARCGAHMDEEVADA